MPELKGITIKGFEDEDQELIDAIPYKDKKREEKRLVELKERKGKLAECASHAHLRLDMRVRERSSLNKGEDEGGMKRCE